MRLRNKTISISLLTLIIILITILSSELTGLAFQPGQSYTFYSEGVQVESGTETSQTFDLGGVGRIAGIIILWLVLPASVVYFMISPEARRQVILRVLSISFSTFAMIIVVRWLATSGGCATIQKASLVMTGEGGGEITEVVFTPVDIPSFRYIGSVLMAIIIVTLVYRIARRIRFRRPDHLERIALETEKAVADLRAGADLKNTIKRCYFEMSQALKDYQGLEREVGMTPREFEASLHGLGLPMGNVRRLTRLFEEVRYGAMVAGDHLEQEAIDLLNAIVQDCELRGSRGAR